MLTIGGKHMSLTDQNKIVKFEGAGWSSAEHNGVGNCRIRGVFTTKQGRDIYLEMGGTKNHGHMAPSLRYMDFPAHVSHCFDLKDVTSNRSYDLCKHEREYRAEYTKPNILKLLNILGVECDDFEVINDFQYSVFEDERYIKHKGNK